MNTGDIKVLVKEVGYDTPKTKNSSFLPTILSACDGMGQDEVWSNLEIGKWASITASVISWEESI